MFANGQKYSWLANLNRCSGARPAVVVKVLVLMYYETNDKIVSS